MRIPSCAVLVLAGSIGCAAAPAPTSADDLAKAFSLGKLRFEVRGLKNEVEKGEYSTTYTHKATVVAIGDSSLTKRPYWVLFSVKRLSGGDPESPRDATDIALVFIRDGVGELEESGGYKIKSSPPSWAAEVIEIAPLAVIPLVPIAGNAVRE